MHVEHVEKRPAGRPRLDDAEGADDLHLPSKRSVLNFLETLIDFEAGTFHLFARQGEITARYISAARTFTVEARGDLEAVLDDVLLHCGFHREPLTHRVFDRMSRSQQERVLELVRQIREIRNDAMFRREPRLDAPRSSLNRDVMRDVADASDTYQEPYERGE